MLVVILEQLGLAAWQAGKVYALCESASATVVHDNDELLDALQGTPRDHAGMAAALLWGSPLLPRERGYRLLQTQRTEGDGNRDLAGRIPLGEPGAGQWWVAIYTPSGYVNQLWGSWASAVVWTDVRTGRFA